MSVDLLLEIGSEEIPDWMIPGALETLRKLAHESGRGTAAPCGPTQRAAAWSCAVLGRL